MEKDINQSIINKYNAIGEDPETYIKGLLYSKPINYWEYIKTETLLSLQNTRTDYKDEEAFIIFSQITELLLKLILNEIKQVTSIVIPEEKFITEKLSRMNCHMRTLISFFGTIKNTISYQEYNNFRFALSPASGFQSVQFKYIELYSTSIENLVMKEKTSLLSVNPKIEECFEYIYWNKAGINRVTKEKSYTFKEFEGKYMDELISIAKKIKGNTLEDKLLKLKKPSSVLIKTFKDFDTLFNIKWPLVHLNLVNHFLNQNETSVPSTGNTEWKNYLHPKFQQCIFFPSLWSHEEKKNWGMSNVQKQMV